MYPRPIPEHHDQPLVHAHRHIVHHRTPQPLIELCHRLHLRLKRPDEPPCPPCLSLREYSSETARDKALSKREEGAFAPPRWGFCTPPKLDKFCHFSICSISQYGFFKISLPTPIKSAALFFRRVSASSKVLTPPVSMTGMETAFFIALDIS